MISKNTFGVQFIIRVNKAKDGKVPIYVRITVDSQRVEMSLKRYVQPIEWNTAKGLARGSRKEIQLKKQLITAKGIKSLFLGEDDKQFTLTKLVTLTKIFSNQVILQEILKEPVPFANFFKCTIIAQIAQLV